jgi:rod shape-determining protein MreC
MSSYLNHTPKSNLIIQHSFNLIFRKIETMFFIFLCIICLIISKINQEFSNKISNNLIIISTPIIKVISFPINSSIDLIVNFKNLAIAKKENIELREELFKLQNYYLTSLAIHQENKELRSALNFVKSKTENYKIARIIGMSHQAFDQNLLIDSGKNRDIKEGQIIAGNRGVIGRVSDVFEDKSRIILLTDSSSRVPIIASRARNRGILAGNNSGLMEILYLPKNHQIAIGDKIFTSSDGDTVPPGLLIGIVKKIDKNSVYVSGIEDINSLNIVTIIDY